MYLCKESYKTKRGIEAFTTGKEYSVVPSTVTNPDGEEWEDPTLEDLHLFDNQGMEHKIDCALEKKFEKV